MTDEEILAVLKGRLIFDGTIWRSYAVDGSENLDPDQVLRRGTHGALIYNASIDDASGADGGATPRRQRHYLKRRGKLLAFETEEAAQAYIDAEVATAKAIEEAKKTSRRARKRLRERLERTAGVAPQDVLTQPLEARQDMVVLEDGVALPIMHANMQSDSASHDAEVLLLLLATA